jgi:hypothetical protein
MVTSPLSLENLLKCREGQHPVNINYINIICLQTICASFTSDVRQPHAARKPPWYTLWGTVNS